MRRRATSSTADPAVVPVTVMRLTRFRKARGRYAVNGQRGAHLIHRRRRGELEAVDGVPIDGTRRCGGVVQESRVRDAELKRAEVMEGRRVDAVFVKREGFSEAARKVLGGLYSGPQGVDRKLGNLEYDVGLNASRVDAHGCEHGPKGTVHSAQQQALGVCPTQRGFEEGHPVEGELDFGVPLQRPPHAVRIALRGVESRRRHVVQCCGQHVHLATHRGRKGVGLFGASRARPRHNVHDGVDVVVMRVLQQALSDEQRAAPRHRRQEHAQ